MIHCGINVEKPIEKVKNNRKPFANLPITTPWRYKVPSNSKSSTCNIQNYYRNLSIKSAIRRQTEINFGKQYYNFLRLMQLFPSVHPANIYGILMTCKCDIYRAIEKLQKIIQSVKGLYRENISKYTNPTRSNYALSSYSGLNNKYSLNNYTRNQPESRNYSNFQSSLSVTRPESVRMVPTFCNEQKTFIKYESIPKNVYS